MNLPQSYKKAKIGDVIKCFPAGSIYYNDYYYAILTNIEDLIYEIDNGEKRAKITLINWQQYFTDILFVKSNQFILKTTNAAEVLLFLVDESDNIINYKSKISVQNPYFKAKSKSITI